MAIKGQKFKMYSEELKAEAMSAFGGKVNLSADP